MTSPTECPHGRSIFVPCARCIAEKKELEPWRVEAALRRRALRGDFDAIIAYLEYINRSPNQGR